MTKKIFIRLRVNHSIVGKKTGKKKFTFKNNVNPLCCTLSYSTISVSRVFKAPLMVILTLARAGAGII